MTEPGVLSDALGRRYLLEFDTGQLVRHTCDVLVVGSGIAGLTAALEASSAGMQVMLVTKSDLSRTATWHAQGGIAGAVGVADSVELHLADTLVVGQGLSEEDVVRAVVGEAAQALRGLGARGVTFDREEGGAPALALEGGHSLPRVLHSGDATGAAVQDALTRAVRDAPKVALRERSFLADLLTAGDRCVGGLVLDPATGALETVFANAVVLATGGCGQAYRVTTNPLIATGDGVAAAFRAGADIADMEFVQFHPTALDSDASPKFLITEALRGDGAHLVDADGDRFMADVHPLGDLAPRDVVSREIERVSAEAGEPHVWLDARHLGAEHLKLRFPTVWEACSEAGYDLSTDLLPVAPAAHYAIGGVRADADGRTSLTGLFASGEAACSGLHGANRLASNSLLEGLVASRRIIRALEPEIGWPASRRIESECPTHAEPPGDARTQVQQLMSARVGTSRSDDGLAEAAGELADLAGTIDGCASDAEGMEVANLVTIASLVTHAAWMRTETRGCHGRVDFPDRDDERWRAHTVWRVGEPPCEVPVGALGWEGV